MSYILYYYRYGSIEKERHKKLEQAVGAMEYISDHGEGFGDCITDEDGVIVRDFDAESEVFGRETPDSRVGKKR